MKTSDSLGRWTVDPWDWHAPLQAQEADPIRRWADLEGKSSTTSDELYQSQLPTRESRPNVFALLAVSVKLVAALVHTWLTRGR
jgi:hypothetical protein